MAQDGLGKGYSQVPQGALSVAAEVRAKPGKEAELHDLPEFTNVN